ncbi:hypothetical protein PHYPSEUDO_009741 [Phytophthora pseudosyringae]|uniref:Uncharacterized protein n=1 Tax=Phytophthora pseudosyringae TaxID=221518 RepID=A0A8T1VCC3_9STRA|nr:hypothetical protein PHYPSEUDO_009741 [Phytophthora pseudosyringae]
MKLERDDINPLEPPFRVRQDLPSYTPTTVRPTQCLSALARSLSGRYAEEMKGVEAEEEAYAQEGDAAPAAGDRPALINKMEWTVGPTQRKRKRPDHDLLLLATGPGYGVRLQGHADDDRVLSVARHRVASRQMVETLEDVGVAEVLYENFDQKAKLYSYGWVCVLHRVESTPLRVVEMDVCIIQIGSFNFTLSCTSSASSEMRETGEPLPVIVQRNSCATRTLFSRRARSTLPTSRKVESSGAIVAGFRTELRLVVSKNDDIPALLSTYFVQVFDKSLYPTMMIPKREVIFHIDIMFGRAIFMRTFVGDNNVKPSWMKVYYSTTR